MSRRSPDPARLRDFFGSFHQSGSQLIGHLSQVSGQRRGNVYFIAQAHCVYVAIACSGYIYALRSFIADFKLVNDRRIVRCNIAYRRTDSVGK